MKQSRFLSLTLCQKYTVQKQSFFPTVSQKLQANQPFANNLLTIYRKCREEMECLGVWKLLKSFRKGDGEPTINYRCSALKHDIWLWWPFAFFCHLDRCPSGEKTIYMPPLVPKNWSVDDRAHLEKSWPEIPWNGSKLTAFSPVRCAKFSVHCATLEPVLGHLWVSKMCPSGLVGNLVLSTFFPH